MADGTKTMEDAWLKHHRIVYPPDWRAKRGVIYEMERSSFYSGMIAILDIVADRYDGDVRTFKEQLLILLRERREWLLKEHAKANRDAPNAGRTDQ